MRQRRQAVEVPLCWLLFWSSFLSFSHSLSTSKRISSAQEFAVPCPCSFAVCSDYSFTKGMVVSTVSAVFVPAVPPHSGCFIQKTWADSPCLTPVCFHSASVSKLFFYLLPMLEQLQLRGKNSRVNTITLCASLPFVFLYVRKITGMKKGDVYVSILFE